MNTAYIDYYISFEISKLFIFLLCKENKIVTIQYNNNQHKNIIIKNDIEYKYHLFFYFFRDLIMNSK